MANMQNKGEKMKWVPTKSVRLLPRFLRDVSGVSAIEYGMLVAGVALTTAVAFYHVGDSLKDIFDQIAHNTPVVASNDSTGDAGNGGNTGGDTSGDAGSHNGNDMNGNTGGQSWGLGAGTSGDSDNSPFGVSWTRGGGSGDTGGGGAAGRLRSGGHGSATIGTSGSGGSAGGSGGAGGASGDMSTPGGASGDTGTGSRLFARADIGQVGSGDISTAGSHSRDSDIGGGGIDSDSIAGDATSGGDPDSMSAGETVSGGGWKNKKFLWLWVLGLTGLAACLPLLYYIRRRQKENRTLQENQIPVE